MKALIRPYLIVLITSLGLAACGQDAQQGSEPEKLWETEGFKNPESVIYDQANEVLYVSNVNGGPGEKDGNGFISRVGLDGEIQELEWVTGLDAPKGLALVGDSLYASDIDTLVEIDVNDATVTNRYQADGAGFLNDVAAAQDGTVYVSDTGTNTIHRLSDGVFEAWLQDDKLNGPNGLLVEGDRLMLASMGPFESDEKSQLFAISLTDKTITSATGGKAVGKLDGLVPTGDGGYYVTDWPAGALIRIDGSGEATQLLDLDQGSADLAFIQEKNLILIPMMMNNKVVAWNAPITQ